MYNDSLDANNYFEGKCLNMLHNEHIENPETVHKQLIIGHSEAAIHCKIAGITIESYEIIIPGKVIVLNSPLFNNGYYIWDWNYTIMDNNISLH